MSAQASNARRGQNHVIGQPSADNKAVVGGGAVWQGVAHAGGGLAVIIGRHGNKRGVRLTHLVPSRRRLQQHIPCFHPSAEPADGRADGGSGDEVVRGAARGCRRCLRPTCRRFPTERQPKSGGSRARAAFAICAGAKQAGSTLGVCDSADALLHFRIPTGLQPGRCRQGVGSLRQPPSGAIINSGTPRRRWWRPRRSQGTARWAPRAAGCPGQLRGTLR